MKKFTLGLIVGLLLTVTMSWAEHIPSPPPSVKDRATLFYLRKLHSTQHKIPITTTDPNGNRRGRSEEVVIWNDSGTYRLRVNTSTTPEGGTTWSSVTS